MITLTKNGLLIEMSGHHYGVDDIQLLNRELLHVLQFALSSEYSAVDSYILFDLLEAISPTVEQLNVIHSTTGEGLTYS